CEPGGVQPVGLRPPLRTAKRPRLTRITEPVGAGNSNSALAGRLQPDRVIGRSVRSMAVAVGVAVRAACLLIASRFGEDRNGPELAADEFRVRPRSEL